MFDGNDGLTGRQQKFVAELLSDAEMNAGRAYERAGYRARGAAADACASRLLRSAKVQMALRCAQAERGERMALSADAVLLQLRADHDAAVAANQFGAGVRALELIGKHLGMFADRYIHEGGEQPVRVVEIVRHVQPGEDVRQDTSQDFVDVLSDGRIGESDESQVALSAPDRPVRADSGERRTARVT